MDFVTGDVRRLFRKYLVASLGSALVTSIYSIVDMIAIGQSEGPLGAAAMAVLLVPFGICAVLGILCGIGGAVFMTSARGKGDKKEGDGYYTCAWILVLIFLGVFWTLLLTMQRPIFRFFGARDEATLVKALEYGSWMIAFFPSFVLPSFIGAFVRNDGAPNRVLTAVIVGGVLNVFGDWLLVFPLGMGMTGAAVATVTGATVQLVIMASHFLSRNCKLRLVSVRRQFGTYARRILRAGLGAAILDLGNVVIVILMNTQIQVYGSVTELAVYGVISSVGALFQALFAGVGQAVQPLVSANFGAGRRDRMRSFWKLGLSVSIMFGVVCTTMGELFPVQIIRLFMDATPDVVAATPAIVRIFFLMYLFLGINVLSTYYLQSQIRDGMAMTVALLRSIILSGVAILTLPAVAGILGVWLALPVSEALTSILALHFVHSTFRSNAPQGTVV